jgi:membrane-associated phospholipid phosphatase
MEHPGPDVAAPPGSGVDGSTASGPTASGEGAPAPDVAGRELRRWCARIAAGAAVTVVVLFVVVALHPAPTMLERDLARMVRRFTVVRGARQVRHLAGPVVIGADLVWTAVFGALLGRLRLALVLVGGAVATTAVNDVVLQRIIVRPGLLGADGIRQPDYFPSSHVVAICCVTAAAVMLVALAGGSPRLVGAAVCTAGALSVAVAWASVFLGAHHVLDVVAAVAVAALGMAATLAVALRHGGHRTGPSGT